MQRRSIRFAGVQRDGATLVVRIPMRFQRRGGRKRIVAPDGSAIVPSSKPQPDGTLVKALARAWRWQRLLHDGVYNSVTEIAEAENISKSYVSRILRLALLAPDIVDAILAGENGSGNSAAGAGAAAAGELAGATAPLSLAPWPYADPLKGWLLVSRPACWQSTPSTSGWSPDRSLRAVSPDKDNTIREASIAGAAA
jgi:Centromere-binding protein HTH domain